MVCDVVYAILFFIDDFAWVVSEFRILLSIIALVPVLPLLFYIWNTEFVEEV